MDQNQFNQAISDLSYNVENLRSFASMSGMFGVTDDASIFFTQDGWNQSGLPYLWLTMSAEYAKAYNALAKAHRAGAFYGMPIVRTVVECFLRSQLIASKPEGDRSCFLLETYVFPDSGSILNDIRRLAPKYLMLGDHSIWSVLCLFSHANPKEPNKMPNAPLHILKKLEFQGEEGPNLDDLDRSILALCAAISMETIAQLVLLKPYNYSMADIAISATDIGNIEFKRSQDWVVEMLDWWKKICENGLMQ